RTQAAWSMAWRAFRSALRWNSSSFLKSQAREVRPGGPVRSDIVSGAKFPDYELSDHTGKHRNLSELQGPHPMVLVLSRGGFCPRIDGRRNYLVNCIAKWKSRIHDWSPSAPTILPKRMNIAAESARTGRFFPTRPESFRRTSTSLNIRIPSTTR